MTRIASYILLLFLTRISCRPQNDENNELETTKPKCSLDNQRAMYENTCHKLYEQGPCNDTEWLVLNDNLEPYCRHRDCEPHTVQHNGRSINFTKILLNNSCVVHGDDSVCPSGMELRLMANGTGQCDCLPGYIFWSAPSESNEGGTCHRPFRQGPCPAGKMLYLPPLQEENNATTQSVCRDNPCEDGQVKVEVSYDLQVRFEAGRCEELGTIKSICGELAVDYQLQVDVDTMELKCISSITHYASTRSNSLGCTYGTRLRAQGYCKSAALYVIAGK